MAFHPPIHGPACRLARISHAVALLALGSIAAHAQQATLGTVTISDRKSPPQAGITGFSDVPLQELPASATVIGRQQIEASGARRLSDLATFEASITDAYNSPGYWDYLTIRGFTLDNRYNYRREGLPFSAETTVPLDNKERVEILKGTSGIQAGTSAPGGLVNYVVKRPAQQALREARLELSSRASVLAAIDLSSRFGAQDKFGLRVNAAQERLRPTTRNLDGERSLLAVAGDWRVDRDSVLDAELEWSRRSQPSQAPFSILGTQLPAVPDPRLNLNNQPWSQPSVFGALTGTVRYERALNAQWRWSAQLGRQTLRTDDRVAFPFGCSAENNYDRFCSDGTFDLYDFRSDGEKRRQDSAALNLKGTVKSGSVAHDLVLAVQESRMRNRFQMRADNLLGSPGNVQGTAVVAPDPSLTAQNTNRDERATELSASDAIRWNEQFTSWLGVRHTRLERESVRTNGSRATAYDQQLTTPWAAISYKLAPRTMAYASWGQGVETEVVPNRAQYTNAGTALPALKSRQWELGLKGGPEEWTWQLAWFNIRRPVSNLDACGRLGITPCTGRTDGQAVHQGMEAAAKWQQGPARLGAGLMLLDATREDSVVEPGINGRQPANVPRVAVRAHAGWRFASVPGLELAGAISHEGKRNVLPDGSLELPAWTRVDAALHYQAQVAGVQTRWTFGVDNVFNRRYWKESPYQFGHVYLYPGAARAARLTFTAAL